MRWFADQAADHTSRYLTCFGGGGGTTTATTNTATTPWAGEQPSLMEVYNGANNLNASGTYPQYYPGDTYSGLTGQQQGLMSNLVGNTQSGGNSSLQDSNAYLSDVLQGANTSTTAPTFGAANNTLSNELSSSYLNPNNSPSYQTAMSNAMASALPAANASFVNGNRSDGGLAQAASTSAAANAAGGLAQQQYDTNQSIQNNAAQQASTNQMANQQQQLQSSFYSPFVDQQQTSDMGTALNTAGMQQTANQNQIDANVAAYNYGQMEPWNDLSMYENAITGTGNTGQSTNSIASQPYYSNTAANVGSGLGAAASIAALIAGL